LKRHGNSSGPARLRASAPDDAPAWSTSGFSQTKWAATAVGFLRHGVKHYDARLRHHRRAADTDNGSAYRSTVHAITCRALAIRHLRTRPDRPRTDGKAERVIRTLISGWAYGAIYRDSAERTAALAGWIDFYNHRRLHGTLSHKPPIARLYGAEQPPRVLHLDLLSRGHIL
jgi:transposase InsO family protein